MKFATIRSLRTINAIGDCVAAQRVGDSEAVTVNANGTNCTGRKRKEANGMRKLVVTEFMSLDGVMEDPGGAEDFAHGGWTFQFPDPEGMSFKLDEIRTHDAMLLGRVTYQGFAAAWPSVTDEVGFADKMNGMPKYVVSTTLDELEWNNSTLIKDNVTERVRELKQAPGRTFS